MISSTIKKTKISEISINISDIIYYFYGLLNVKKEEVGLINFCSGSHIYYLVATLNDIKATASFYSAGITSLSSREVEPTLSCTPDISGTIHLSLF